MSYVSEGGVNIDFVFARPFSTQSVWQATVAITTQLQVAFLSHQPVSRLLSVGAFFSHSTEGQQTSTMCAGS